MREPRPDWSPLGVNFKILDEHPYLFLYIESPPPPPRTFSPVLYLSRKCNLKFEKKNRHLYGWGYMLYPNHTNVCKYEQCIDLKFQYLVLEQYSFLSWELVFLLINFKFRSQFWRRVYLVEYCFLLFNSTTAFASERETTLIFAL